MTRKSGFTLTELLVVIAVIATLAAILFPVFAQVREKARQTTCLSNMKQIGTAMMLYLEDHDDVLLPAWTVGTSAPQPNLSGGWYTQSVYVSWTELLQPYLQNRSVFYCPSFDERVLVENAALPTCDGPGIRAWFPARYYYAHYGLATDYTGGSCTPERPRSRDAGNMYWSSSWLTLAQVARPAETAVLQDNFTAQMATGALASAFGCEGGFRGAGQSRHQKGCNYLFLDGHTKLLVVDPRTEPTIACPGAAIPGTSQAVPNCRCTKYTTFDY